MWQSVLNEFSVVSFRPPSVRVALFKRQRKIRLYRELFEVLTYHFSILSDSRRNTRSDAELQTKNRRARSSFAMTERKRSVIVWRQQPTWRSIFRLLSVRYSRVDSTQILKQVQNDILKKGDFSPCGERTYLLLLTQSFQLAKVFWGKKVSSTVRSLIGRVIRLLVNQGGTFLFQ